MRCPSYAPIYVNYYLGKGNEVAEKLPAMHRAAYVIFLPENHIIVEGGKNPYCDVIHTCPCDVIGIAYHP